MAQEKLVLVADDDQDQRTVLRSVLQANGYRVLEAVNESQALEMARAEKPDLAILDVMMDEMDSGFQVCRQIREHADLKETRVIILTSVGEKTGINFSTDDTYLPADDYVPKPIEPDDLIRRVKKLIG